MSSLSSASTPRRTPDLPLRRIDRFNYIIVGGGTAGLVLADRLSETKGVSVIVLEAGIDYQVTSN